jgi:protein gp37
MGDTSIEWTDCSWNPVRGCARVSPGCEHCYAEGTARRMDHPGGLYEGLTTMGKHGPKWRGHARYAPDKLGDPLKWKSPRKIFVASMSDPFHHDVRDEHLDEIFAIMVLAGWHTYQLLTKRVERALEYLIDPNRESRVRDAVGRLRKLGYYGVDLDSADMEWPLPNLHLVASCENQEWLDKRVPVLLKCPAVVRGVSCEPLLGPIVFGPKMLGQSSDCPECGPDVQVDDDGCCIHCGRDCMWYGLDWVVTGGESGRLARECRIDDITAIVAQCHARQVPCFVKQLGAVPMFPIGSGLYSRLPLKDKKGGDITEWPEALQVRQWPREAGAQ